MEINLVQENTQLKFDSKTEEYYWDYDIGVYQTNPWEKIWFLSPFISSNQRVGTLEKTFWENPETGDKGTQLNIIGENGNHISNFSSLLDSDRDKEVRFSGGNLAVDVLLDAALIYGVGANLVNAGGKVTVEVTAKNLLKATAREYFSPTMLAAAKNVKDGNSTGDIILDSLPIVGSIRSGIDFHEKLNTDNFLGNPQLVNKLNGKDVNLDSDFWNYWDINESENGRYLIDITGTVIDIPEEKREW